MVSIQNLKNIGNYNNDAFDDVIYLWFQEKDHRPRPVELQYSYHPEWGDDEYHDTAIIHFIGTDCFERYSWTTYGTEWKCYPLSFKEE